MASMERKYRLLRREIYDRGIRQTEICEKLGKSQTWLSNRLLGDACFTIDEGYELLSILKVPKSEFTEYFPRGGYTQ